MIRSDSAARAILVLVLAYLFSLGATFNGVLIPAVKQFTLILTGTLVILWCAGHFVRGWRWHRTPLDLVMLLWVLAFGLSLAANPDSWRRIVMGLWYVGIYVAAWYALADLLSNRALSRDIVVDAFLIGALPVVVFGYVQMRSASIDLARLELPRPGSIIGNPNALGVFLVVLISLTLGRWLSVSSRLGQLVLAMYTVAVFALIVATFSRGAWLGTVTALAVLTWLVMDEKGLTSRHQLRDWYRALGLRSRTVLQAGVILLIGAALVASALLISSFQTKGRNLDLRTRLYADAWAVFAEKPLTGHGLFTFGQHFARMQSQPPLTPHSHAHNAILHIGAELGITGLAALFSTAGVLAAAARRNWKSVRPRDRMLVAGSIAGSAGFAAHHLADFPAMMPVISLAGLIALGIATIPDEPAMLATRRRRLVQPGMITLLWATLLLSGWWSTSVYVRYTQALRLVNDDDYRGAADALQAVIRADPSLAIYHSQQAYLYGVAASEGDSDALARGIAAYERFLAIEPQNAAGWANLAGLYWQAGQGQAAAAAMARAAGLAPDAWQLWLNLGMYAEAAGSLDRARLAYSRALTLETCVLPFWDETSLRRDMAQAVVPPDFSAAAGLRPCVAWAVGRYETTGQTLKSEAVLSGDESLAWTQVQLMRATVFEGSENLARQQLAAACDLIAPDITRADYDSGQNIGHFQFLRFVIPRQFLPQVYYPVTDPLLLRFIHDLSVQLNVNQTGNVPFTTRLFFTPPVCALGR